MHSNRGDNVCKYYDIFRAEMVEGFTVLLSNFADKNSGLSDFTKTGFRAMKLNKQENKRPIPLWPWYFIVLVLGRKFS